MILHSEQRPTGLSLSITPQSPDDGLSIVWHACDTSVISTLALTAVWPQCFQKDVNLLRHKHREEMVWVHQAIITHNMTFNFKM